MAMFTDDCFELSKYEENMSASMFYVEKELGAYITDDYPLVKLNAQIYELTEHLKREDREMKKSQSKRGTIG